MATPDSGAPRSSDDATARRIVCDLDSNFIVEAGAGTGKTYALVSRVIALVKAGPEHGGARMENIVAITFTETAAAELFERIRSRMEQLLDTTHPDHAGDLLLPLSGDERARVTVADRGTGPGHDTNHSQLCRPAASRASHGRRFAPGLGAAGRSGRSTTVRRAVGKLAGVGAGRTAATFPLSCEDALRYLVRANIGIARWQGIARAFSEHYEKLRADHTVQAVRPRTGRSANPGGNCKS